MSLIAFLLLSAVFIQDAVTAKWSARKILKRESFDAIITSIRTGDDLGITECRKQFHKDKWNCSATFTSHNMKSGLPRIVQATAANREMAYVQSIRAAGVTYSLTRDCRKGNFQNCNCLKGSANTAHDWSGCHDNVKFGDVLCRHFLDSLESRSSKKLAAINLHNNAVGRKAVKATLRTTCKCHGVSGSCSTKSCWKSLSSFAEVGDFLKHKYQKAKKVRMRNSKLVHKITKQLFKPLAKRDRSLVFIKSSPDYCHANAARGSTGVLGRVCSSERPDYVQCSEMCMSCGYKIVKKLVVRSYRCNCKFVWCCNVKCGTCKRLAVVGTCQRS